MSTVVATPAPLLDLECDLVIARGRFTGWPYDVEAYAVAPSAAAFGRFVELDLARLGWRATEGAGLKAGRRRDTFGFLIGDGLNCAALFGFE